MNEDTDTDAARIANLGNVSVVKANLKANSKEKRDSAVQGRDNDVYTYSGTNDSSIVSKRSVERIGYPVRSAKGQWLRHFVKRPLRRSPLINIGYYVRIKAIEKIVDEVTVLRIQVDLSVSS
jgi:hypothetical protein